MGYLFIALLALLSGILGRMGGAGKSGQWYENILDTKWRDVGCSLIAVARFLLLFGFAWKWWWVYLIMFGLHWASFSTYWDFMFKEDNLWFSGFMVGISSMIGVVVLHWLWWVVLAWAVFLAVVWGCLNKFLPQKILCWRRDVAEEFLRYTVAG